MYGVHGGFVGNSQGQTDTQQGVHGRRRAAADQVLSDGLGTAPLAQHCKQQSLRASTQPRLYRSQRQGMVAAVTNRTQGLAASLQLLPQRGGFSSRTCRQ